MPVCTSREKGSQMVFFELCADHAETACVFGSPLADVLLAGHHVEIDPCAVLVRYHAFGAENRAVFIHIRELHQYIADLLFGVFADRLDSPAGKYIVRMMMSVVVMSVMIMMIVIMVLMVVMLMVVVLMLFMFMIVVLVLPVVMIGVFMLLVVMIVVFMLLMFMVVVLMLLVVMIMLMYRLQFRQIDLEAFHGLEYFDAAELGHGSRDKCGIGIQGAQQIKRFLHLLRSRKARIGTA